MNFLALETAVDPGSVALWRDGKLSSKICPEALSNSETLLPVALEVLREAGLSFADLDAIAFGAGPGSFTGLRVACGVAQGLSVARDLPLIGIGSLAAMAHASAADRVFVALDARMGEVYFGYFEQGEQQGDIGVCAPEDVPLPNDQGWTACGNGLNAYPVLRERFAAYVRDWQCDIAPSATAVAQLAAPRLARGERLDPADAVPLYVRNKVAKTVAERLAEGGKA